VIARLFNHPRVESARRWMWAVTDRIAFVAESACVANVLFWALTYAALSFSWGKSAREWGHFWTHYAAASADRRAPVELFLLATMLVLTSAVAWIRFPKSSACWSPWPTRDASVSSAGGIAEDRFA
jgi:hypothetical protein